METGITTRTLMLSKEDLKKIEEQIEKKEEYIEFPRLRFDRWTDLDFEAKLIDGEYEMFVRVYINGTMRVEHYLDECFGKGYFAELPRELELDVPNPKDEDDEWLFNVRFDVENRVESPLDWSDIMTCLEEEPPMLRSEWDCMGDDEDGWVRARFIGTVFGLTPSGKYYLPFACSNVMGCPECDGAGTIEVRKEKGSESISCVRCGGSGSEEGHRDEIWREAMEKEADDRGVSLECGEGDPCDMFVVRYYDKDEIDPETVEI